MPLALIAGLAFGAGIVVLSDILDAALFTADEVESALGVPALGSVPLLASTLDRKTGLIAPERFVVQSPLSLFAEAFRTLRVTALAGTAAATGGSAILAVTSSLVGESKTTTSLCLARLAAMSGAKVLLIDCDIRSHAVGRYLGLEQAAGLVEVISGATTLEEAMVRDELTQAYILPISTRQTTVKDVFSDPGFDSLLVNIRKKFDFIVLDLPPVLAVAEAATVAGKADAVICLARWAKTPRHAIEKAIKMLRLVNAPLTGIVLTMVDAKEQARSGYGDSGYYTRAYAAYYTQ